MHKLKKLTYMLGILAGTLIILPDAVMAAKNGTSTTSDTPISVNESATTQRLNGSTTHRLESFTGARESNEPTATTIDTNVEGRTPPKTSSTTTTTTITTTSGEQGNTTATSAQPRSTVNRSSTGRISSQQKLKLLREQRFQRGSQQSPQSEPQS